MNKKMINMIKKNSGRFLPTAIILALIVPVLLTACAGVPGSDIPPVTTVPAASSPSSSRAAPSSSPAPVSTRSAADELFDSLEPVDYAQAEFRIAAYHSKNIFPSSAGDIIDDLVLERNLKIEDKFNIKLNQVSVPVNDFFNVLKSDYFSGLPGCDLIVAPADMLDYFVTFSMYSNVNKLGVDFSKPCYNKSAMDSMSTGVITYAVAGSLTDSPENSYCVFANRALLKQIGGEDLTQTVLEGKWTWSAANSLAASAVRNKLTGICSSVDDKTFINLIWASTGTRFFTNEPPYNPQISLDSASASNITRLISNTMNSSAYYDNSSRQSKGSYELFKEGKCLFFISRISQFTALGSTGMSVAVLPLPKLNEQQISYSSYLDNTFQVTYVPVNCPDTARAGVILDALNTSSYNMVDNAYLSLYMHMYLSSNDEALIVNEVFENQFYEIGFVLGPVYNQFASASYDMIYRAVTAGASLSTVIRQNKTQFSRFLTNKIFDYPKEPVSTAPQSSAPASTVAPTVPVTTSPATSGASAATPSAAIPASTSPGTTSPRTTSPATTSPGSTAPRTSSPASTASKTSAPTSTAPASTLPATSAPASSSSAPSSTQPVSTSPASTAPSSETPLSLAPVTAPASSESSAPETSAPASSAAEATETQTPASSSDAPASSLAPATSQTPEPTEAPATTAAAPSAQPEATEAPSQTEPAA